MTPTLEETKTRKRNKQRIVEEHTDKEFWVCGHKTNRNVWELQQLYENYQMKSTKLIPEFFERIKFLIISGILRASFSKSVDQNGELFNYVVESLMRKIIPYKDPKTGKLTTRYDYTKTNLGAYILNSCYWSVREFTSGESWHESLLSASDYLEDTERASFAPTQPEIGHLKMIVDFEQTNKYVPVIQDILQGAESEN